MAHSLDSVDIFNRSLMEGGLIHPSNEILMNEQNKVMSLLALEVKKKMKNLTNLY